MKNRAIRKLLREAHGILAETVGSEGGSYSEAMDQMMRLFDPKGPFNAPTRNLALEPDIERAVLRVRDIMEQFRDGNRESVEEAAVELWTVLDEPALLRLIEQDPVRSP